MKPKAIDQRVKELFEVADILWLAEIGHKEKLEKAIVEMLLDQIGDCREAARLRYEEAEMNRREFEDCGRTVANHWIAKKDTAAKIIQDIDKLAAPYEPKKNPNIG